MTLGERIQALRRERGMSQEGLAEVLGISRQAVSKWEKGLSCPDTGNLLALAELFGVSADELAGLRQQEAAGESSSAGEPPEASEPASMEDEAASPPKRRFPRWVPVAAVALAALAVVMIPVTVYMAIRRMETGPVVQVPSDTAETEEQPAQGARPGTEATGEFALLWATDGGYEFLKVGEQEECFPFGTTLTRTTRETVRDTDYGRVSIHEVACGALHLTYTHNSGEEPEQETVEAVAAIVAGYETPRCIQVGSNAQDVLSEYENALVYLLKESGNDVLCPHDYRYAYAPADAYGKAILFYIADGHVAGIEVRNADDRGNEAWAVDNETIFPIVDGQPDFSARQEPEGEQTDATQIVYIALQALENDANLSAEEVYRYRQDIYGNLQHMSWQEFGRLGEAGKTDETIFALLNWLAGQDTLSEDEIYGLQAGVCLRTDLDGAYAEGYGTSLGRAFVLYPETYVRILADRDFTDEEREMIVTSTAWDAGMFPEECQAAMGDLEHGLMLTDAQSRWQQAMLEKFRELYPDGIG